MALTGLDIFKLLPKSNCKKCGMPTCLAFAMQLAQKKAKLDDCPCASEEARESLAAAAAPPMRQIKFGSGDNEVSAGQETVLFRHDEKFYSPTIVAVTVSDKLTGDELQKRIESINALQFERVGCKIGVSAIAVINDSGEADAFAATAAKTDELSDLALILCSDSPEAMAAATAKTGGS
jgi:acetyl-CoA decarbonylase/synthase complex subunit gamma